jgi:hypothetical protein
VSTLQPAYTPVDAAMNLRRSSIVGVFLAVAGIVIGAFLGHPLVGVFALIGLALGAANNFMLQKSVQEYAAEPTMNKKKFRHGVLGRLGAVTVLAIGAGLLVRPDGFGVFVGLAAFQILMLVGAALPVFRSLRPSS